MTKDPAGEPASSTEDKVSGRGLASAWGPVFIGTSIGISLVMHVAIAVPLGFSASSDAVFGIEALISGVVADFILKKRLAIRMTVKGEGGPSALWVWIPLCLYVIATRPFE